MRDAGRRPGFWCSIFLPAAAKALLSLCGVYSRTSSKPMGLLYPASPECVHRRPLRPARPAHACGAGICGAHFCDGATASDGVTASSDAARESGTHAAPGVGRADAAGDAAGDVNAVERADGWRERILIVEEDAALQRTLAFTLAGLGYDVQTAANGRAALRAWRLAAPEERPQLLLADVEMPALDGIELLRLVRADDPDLPVIVMTAFTSGAALIHALRLHADDFLGKPVEIAELKTALDRALRARRQRIAYEAERTRAARLQAVLETATAVNHEINNPLAAISASAQLLRYHLHINAEAQRTQNVQGTQIGSLTPANERAQTTPEMDAMPEANRASLHHLLDVIIEQCERIADFNRKLAGVVNPVTRSAGGQRMLDVEQSR